METRAHFVLIGLFTLLGIIGGLGFFLWIASVQIDRQYAQYGVLFEDVSGLNNSADVSFNGVSVGRVIGIRIWEPNPSQVFVTIEIDAATPIAVDTVAQLASQGVTGVAYIALSGGSPRSPQLEPPNVGTLPIIQSRQSSLQSFVDSAPDLLGDASTLIKQLEALTGPENQDSLSQTLKNIEAATGHLEMTLSTFNDSLPALQGAIENITGVTATFEAFGEDASNTFANADGTLEAISDLAIEASAKLDQLQPILDNLDRASAAFSEFLAGDLPTLSATAGQTILTAEDAFTRMNDALADTQDILRTDIEPALADARIAMTAFANTMETVATEVPAAVTDLRATVRDARAAITTAVPGLREFGRLGPEARAVVNAIGDLVRQLSRDPAGNLFDNRVPDYRR